MQIGSPGLDKLDQRERVEARVHTRESVETLEGGDNRRSGEPGENRGRTGGASWEGREATKKGI
ncbi:hypothetical protein GCM10027056_27480 [Glaciibacter psychrotolerans]